MDHLERIAAALERLSPPPPPMPDLGTGGHFRFDGQYVHAIDRTDILPLDRFVGIDAQKAALLQNTMALGRGAPAHDILLWGARGMGKSALLRAVAATADVPLVEARSDRLEKLPLLFRLLKGENRAFLVYIDDLAFKATDGNVRFMRSILDGGVEARPDNVRVAVTSNHRHLIAIEASDTATMRHSRDIDDDQLALVDRFGLVLGFHRPDQDEYLEMVRRHVAPTGLAFEKADALEFARGRGGISGRTAWHYRNELLARAAAGQATA